MTSTELTSEEVSTELTSEEVSTELTSEEVGTEPASNDLNNELVHRLLRTATIVTKRLDRALSSVKGISFSEYQLLAALGDLPGATGTRIALAEAVGLTPSGVTRALKPLEKLGFVTTTRDERDARRSLAALTPGGHELVDDASGVVSDVLNGLDALDRLSAEQRRLMVTLLEGLAR